MILKRKNQAKRKRRENMIRRAGVYSIINITTVSDIAYLINILSQEVLKFHNI